MGNLDENIETEPSYSCDDTEVIANVVKQSSEFSGAVESFASLFEQRNRPLLFLGVVQGNFHERQRILFSKFSIEVNAWLLHHNGVEANPLSLMASQGNWQFPDLGRGTSGKIDLFQNKLKFELNRKGLQQSDCVTVKFGSIEFVFIVGSSAGPVSEEGINRLKSVCACFVTGLSVRYSFENIFGAVGNSRSVSSTDCSITERQRQCLEWIASGKTSYEISIILGLSEHTVNNYINDACKRLRAVSRIQAVVIAMQSGLIDLPLLES